MYKFFRAGAAQVDITPPPDLPMDGYLAREGNSLGTHDPLMAQVLVVDDGEKRIALVALDILAVSAGFTDPLRQALAQQLNTTPSAIMMCASHTHCGPVGLQSWFPPGEKPALDKALVNSVQTRILEAAQVALNAMTPVRLTSAHAPVEGIGGDRNRRDNPIDTQVTVVCFERDDHSPLCILFHYACHPTVLGADTRQYSADFVGAARAYLCQQYPGAVPMFLNGALGDVSPRYQRHEQSFAEVERMGRLLSEHIMHLMRQLQPDDQIDLDWHAIPLELPFRTLSSNGTIIPAAPDSGRFEVTRAQGSAIQATLRAAIGDRDSQTATLAILKIGSWSLIGVPGEPFNALAVAVRKISPNALVIGLTNDYAGYFPTQAAIDLQTYESLSSPYDARALDLIQAAVSDQFSQPGDQ
jgi:hypothetical protein